MTSTPRPHLHALPYLGDCAAYFDSIHSALPSAVLLQSNHQPGSTRQRFDILSAAPLFTLQTRQGRCTVSGDTTHVPTLAGNSFDQLKTVVDHLTAEKIDYSQCVDASIPFCGGLIGYCSYDIAREYMALAGQPLQDIDIPDMQFSFYAWACIQDHLRQCSWLVIHPACDAALRQTLLTILPTSFNATTEKPVSSRHVVSSHRIVAQATSFDTAHQQYLDAVQRIKDYLLAGDTYQVNFAQRISLEVSADPVVLYRQLRTATPSPYCTLLPVTGEDAWIISLSPERFLQVSASGAVKTQPIKGTIRRGTSVDEDKQLANQLQQDAKNLAENVMIVDLLRNDIGQVCESGSVKVQSLCELHSFANVHHLVSTITGQLTANHNAVDALRACFPGGSITGAPKLRAMQIIDELEPTRRSVYCGSIVYFSTHGMMDSNILIRTLLLTGKIGSTQKLYCWGGGGIVADSDPESEYQESLTKVGALLQSLQP